MKLLDRINRTDTTVVMATHDSTIVDQMRKRVIELDGGQHVERAAYDCRRTEWLRLAGWRVARFWDNEVLKEMDAVLERIASLLLEAPHPGPLPAMRGEGEGEGGDAPSPACGRGPR